MAVHPCDSFPPSTPPPPRQSPLLMLPLDEDEDGHGCRFFSIKDKAALALRGFSEIFSESRCVGSSHGWLVLLDKVSGPYLLDPLHGGRRVLRLPPVETFPCVLRVFRRDHDEDDEDDGCDLAAFYETVHLGCWRSTTLLSLLTLRDYIISKAVLSGNPNDVDNGKSCWVVVIFGSESKLAFCGCKDFGRGGAWTELTGGHAPYSDVIFYDGTLFALCNNGFVEAWDFNRDRPLKIMKIKSSFPQKSAEAVHALRKVCFTNSYLVEAGGQILLLVRFAGYFVNGDGVPVEEDYLLTEEDIHPLVCPYRTLYFHVYRLDMNTEEWVGLDSIGHHAVFVGGSHSTSVSAREFPELEASSVYFTDDNWEPVERDDLYGGHDMGVYSLQSGKVKEICELGSDKIEPPPFWVFPCDYRRKRMSQVFV